MIYSRVDASAMLLQMQGQAHWHLKVPIRILIISTTCVKRKRVQSLF